MVKPIDPGELRNRIIVYAVDSVIEGTYTVEEERELFTVYGRIVPLTENKFFEAAAVFAKQLETVTVRYRKDITPKCRLFYNGAMHRIVSMVDIENRHAYLEIQCEALENG